VSVQNTTSLPTGQVGEPFRSSRIGHQVEPFAAIPHALVSDLRLTATAVRLVAVLLRYAKSKSSCWPSVATLAADLGRCERTIQLSLRRLISAGWVATRPDSNPTGRVIILVWREKAVAPPPVKLPYSQGLPRPQAVAPEAEKGRERKGSAPAVGSAESENPMTHAELRDLLALNLPATSPLLHVIEQKLARALGRTPGAPTTSPAAGLTIGSATNPDSSPALPCPRPVGRASVRGLSGNEASHPR